MEFSVVVAEDESLLLHVHDEIKKIEQLGLGFSVKGSAQTGIQALELVRDLAPDVLVTDIRMPVMDGLELVEKAKELFPDLDCIIVSGYSDFEYAREAVHLQVREYLTKPLESNALKEVFLKLKEKYESNREQLANEMDSQEELPPVEAVRQYLETHYQEEANMNILADKIHYSQGYLTKIFFDSYRKTPMRYLTDLRITKAKELIDETPSLSVREVGERVGYPDPSYFSRVFKKTTGMSPQKYATGGHVRREDEN